MENRRTKRLQRELQLMEKFKNEFHIQLPKKDVITLWHVTFVCPQDTIYANEKYTFLLTMQFNQPIESPEVVFIGKTPMHEHIYSNGWSAAMNVNSICRSIVSMLSSAKQKKKPENDEDLKQRAKGKSPKDFVWTYEDDKC